MDLKILDWRGEMFVGTIALMERIFIYTRGGEAYVTFSPTKLVTEDLILR